MKTMTKTNFKRAICVLLIAIMAFTLCACSKDEKEEVSDPAENSQSTDVSGEPSVEPEATPVPENMVDVVVVTGEGVYIRASASTDEEPLGYADSGATFQLVNKDNPDWFQIKYNGEDAYITTLYSEIKQIKQAAYDTLFPEVPDTEESGEDPAGATEDESEEPSSVTAEDTRESEDGER